MALSYYEQIGEMTIQQGEHKFKIAIHNANCLAAFVYHSNSEPMLYMFLYDAAHAKRIVKNQGSLFGDKVLSVKLNTFYPTSVTLMRTLTKCGYKVTCYYKEIK